MNKGDKIHAIITLQKIKNGVPTVLTIEGRNYILQQQKVVTK